MHRIRLNGWENVSLNLGPLIYSFAEWLILYEDFENKLSCVCLIYGSQISKGNGRP